MHVYDVVIVGAGPAGLAAAIAAEQQGLDGRVFEKGVVANSIFQFPVQMVFFTTPELLEIGGLPFLHPTKTDARRSSALLSEGRRRLRPDNRFGQTVTELRQSSVDSDVGLPRS